MAQNTTQGLNGAKYAGNFIMQANAPLDDRTVVDTKSKLLEYDNYVYPGMLEGVDKYSRHSISYVFTSAANCIVATDILAYQNIGGGYYDC